MPRIVLSYRRDDSPGMALAIFNRLESRFGPNAIFMDVDIPYGTDFRNHINEVLNDCDTVIAIVGKKWLGLREDETLRIKSDDDWVRLEIETALRLKVPVIPALVDGASMPSKSELPESLDDFRFRQAAKIDGGRDFFPQMEALIRQLDQLLVSRGKQPSLRHESPAPRPSPQPDPKPQPATSGAVTPPSSATKKAPASPPAAKKLPDPPRAAAPAGMPSQVRFAAMLLLAAGVTRLAFLASSLGAALQNNPAVLVESFLLPAVIALLTLAVGYAVMTRQSWARTIGIWVCAFGVLYQLYGLTRLFAVVASSMSIPWTFWLLVPAYAAIYAASLVIFLRWQPDRQQ